MTRQTIFLIVFTLLTQASLVTPAMAETREEKILRHSAKVKASIAKLGVGEPARADIKLRDKTRLKGYIRDAGEDSFVVVDSKTGIATSVSYPQVKQIKGHNLSTDVKIAIGVAVVAGILVVIFILGNVLDD